MPAFKGGRKARILRQIAETEIGFGVTELPKKFLLDFNRLENPHAPERLGAPAAGWEELSARAAACTQCRLADTRTQVVFGEGNRRAELMFVGEAPGFDEDREGKPFVGKAGQLLTKIIEAMGLARSDVYIANCLKCRPPGNRNPLPDEIGRCQPYLKEQIALVRPRVICALGKFAAQTLLETDAPISRLRGRFHDWNGIKLMPTFHPAYLLRNPADKKLVWEDIQQIMAELGLKRKSSVDSRES